jgi:creatinine amidohydrolase
MLLAEMTREEARRLAPDALVLLPVGAVEQHGPHLPTGVDTFAVTHIAHTAAARVADPPRLVVAPTLPFGSSHHHLPFGGTLSLGSETYYRVLCDLAESLIRSGFRRIFILNGHGGNNELIQLVARDTALKHDAHLAAAAYWSIAWDALVAAGAHAQSPVPGHAGSFETALTLALRPELVREPRPRRAPSEPGDTRGFAPYRAELHGAWQRIDGFTDSPDQAEAAQGAHYLEIIASEVARALDDFVARTHIADAERKRLCKEAS